MSKKWMEQEARKNNLAEFKEKFFESWIPRKKMGFGYTFQNAGRRVIWWKDVGKSVIWQPTMTDGDYKGTGNTSIGYLPNNYKANGILVICATGSSGKETWLAIWENYKVDAWGMSQLCKKGTFLSARPLKREFLICTVDTEQTHHRVSPFSVLSFKLCDE